jgi:DNA-binding NarL/FixJ family response regulator
VLLDINLPDQAGSDAYRLVQERDGGVLVVFISADENTDTPIEALKLGPFDWRAGTTYNRHVVQ